jgi:hypothetical protein
VLAKWKHIEAIPSEWRTWGTNVKGSGALSLTLEENRELALLFKRLATLREDIPLFSSVDELRAPST